MINGNIEQFLDTGWFNEATLFYNGYIYWCESYYDFDKECSTFFIDKWAALNENNTLFHTLLNNKGKVEYERVFECSNKDMDYIKKMFLTSKIFDGKTFWEVEQEIAWLEEGNPIQYK